MSSSPKIAALFVGINKYPISPLNGCVADVQWAYEWQARNLKLAKERTQILFDSAATRQNIARGLQWLASQPVDVALFLYSGHGTRIRDLDGDEATGYDQAIVPVDFQKAGLVLDDDLQRQYRLFAPETKIVVHFDSCYSANSDRSISAAIKDSWHKFTGKRQPRFISQFDLGTKAIRATYAGVNRDWKPLKDASRQILLLSGCRDFETSADAYISKKDGYRGAFTYHLQQAIKSFGKDADYLTIIEDARRRLAAQGFSQIPQITGRPEWLKCPIYT